MHHEPMQLLIFLIATIMFIGAGNLAIMYLWEMSQPGGAFDIIFKWQKVLDRWYAKAETNNGYRFLHDAMGGCEKCTSFWFMPVWYWLFYYVCMKFGFHVWLTDGVDSFILSAIINIAWQCVFWTIGAFGGLLLIKKRSNHAV